jgi:hypothetical protein
MTDTLRLYLDAVLAIAVMLFLAVVAAFIAAAVTGDRTVVLISAAVAFVLAGAALIVRLWMMIERPATHSNGE